jgi:hypothetical protein
MFTETIMRFTPDSKKRKIEKNDGTVKERLLLTSESKEEMKNKINESVEMTQITESTSTEDLKQTLEFSDTLTEEERKKGENSHEFSSLTSLFDPLKNPQVSSNSKHPLKLPEYSTNSCSMIRTTTSTKIRQRKSDVKEQSKLYLETRRLCDQFIFSGAVYDLCVSHQIISEIKGNLVSGKTIDLNFWDDVLMEVEDFMYYDIYVIWVQGEQGKKVYEEWLKKEENTGNEIIDDIR